MIRKLILLVYSWMKKKTWAKRKELNRDLAHITNSSSLTFWSINRVSVSHVIHHAKMLNNCQTDKLLSGLGEKISITWLPIALRLKLIRENITLKDQIESYLNRKKGEKENIFILYQERQFIRSSKVNSPPIPQFPFTTCLVIWPKSTWHGKDCGFYAVMSKKCTKKCAVCADFLLCLKE